MSSKLSPYPPPPSVRSSLLKNVPEMGSMPSIDELEQLQAELKLLRQAAAARSKKASEDLRTIQESMRRMKDKEKGKAKAVEKVKRERDYTPPLPDDSRSGSHFPGLKPRMSSTVGGSIHSSRSSVDPRRSAIDDKKLKKRKHAEVDPGDSDGNHSVQRARKGSPAPSTQSFPPKAQKTVPPPQISQQKLALPDFTVPVSKDLLPPRPPIPPPPIAGPSKPEDVKEDFTKLKAPAQTPVNTFYSSIESYLRPIREEDIGFLEYTGDEVEPFVMPKLGVHYLEVWEEQDALGLPLHTLVLGSSSNGGAGKHREAPASAFVAPKPTWDPSTLADGDLTGESKGHGPLTERVISALLPIPDPGGWKGVKAAEDAMEGRPGGSGAAAARRERLNVTDLENRIRDTLRYHGLLESQPDFSERVDDPIATALRHAQQELRVVVATNKARKERLAAIARDRLGYQEYLEIRDMIDKNITNLYAKLQKKDVPKLNKKKKKVLAGAAAASHAASQAALQANINGVSSSFTENGENGTPGPGQHTGQAIPPCPAALGMTPDEENRLMVSDQLKQLVDTRKQWVEQVGSVFQKKQEESPGRIWGFPEKSVYEGIDEEVMGKVGGLLGPGGEMVTATSKASGSVTPKVANGVATSGIVGGGGADKDKRKAVEDAMDIG
ncbi:hypothetical protein FA15DRAFT_668079 [Coprinopsis marcescibilis]|uniref:Uncharacterized protein n=1 Tax=Coprinopsis marcescibilis TaxID=230819 RepID=A0A5C3L100_COPMA|nr:hypothetical protein FA15DRAFT_668079 [Coprinopsis marcescibilis]